MLTFISAGDLNPVYKFKLKNQKMLSKFGFALFAASVAATENYHGGIHAHPHAVNPWPHPQAMTPAIDKTGWFSEY